MYMRGNYILNDDFIKRPYHVGGNCNGWQQVAVRSVKPVRSGFSFKREVEKAIPFNDSAKRSCGPLRPGGLSFRRRINHIRKEVAEGGNPPGVLMSPIILEKEFGGGAIGSRGKGGIGLIGQKGVSK